MTAPLSCPNAMRILAGDIPQADHPILTPDEWRNEAQAAVDNDDESDLCELLVAQAGRDGWMNAFDDRARRYEARTGKGWDESDELLREWHHREPWGMTK